EELAKQLGGDQEELTPENAPAVAGSAAIGLSLQALNPPIARAVHLPGTARGVVITAVDPNSDASEKGIQRGDLILSVNQQPVTTPAQVQGAVTAARAAGR